MINVSAGSVTFASNIVTSNGQSTLSPNQCAAIYCVTYSGGTSVFASISAGSPTSAPPGQVSNLSASSFTSSSLSLSWLAPASGGAPTTYNVQYRVTGTATWLSSGQTSTATNFTINGLQAATGYDVTVIPANNVGTGPVSATVSAATLSANTLPGAPVGVSITNITATGMTCSWNAPTMNGAGVIYVVNYRKSGQSNWTQAASNLTAATTNLTGLTPATAYDIQVTASNSQGTGPASTTVNATTTAASQDNGIIWNLVPVGTFAHGAGAIGLNVHLTSAAPGVEFGFSTSSTVPPASWVGGLHVNSDLWGAYVTTPSTPGTWFAWAEGTDGSSRTVFATPFTVT